MSDLLTINNLKVWFKTNANVIRAVDGVSFNIKSGETYALLGESGSGKTVTALTISQLLTDANFAKISGVIKFYQQDLLNLPELIMQKIRGKKIAFIFQEPMTALNPILTVKQQIYEVLPVANLDKLTKLLIQVGLKNATDLINFYPHQLSGGMRQRVMIAMALACEPELLIADEPTTALDVTTQAQILALIKSLQQQRNMSVLLITHDLGIVANMVDKIGIIYAGQIVEEATPQEIFTNPRHPYTIKLLQALPSFAKRGYKLTVIKNAIAATAGCRFANHCQYSENICRHNKVAIKPSSNNPQHLIRCVRQPLPEIKQNHISQITNHHQSMPVLQIKQLCVSFPITQGLFKRKVGEIKAVNNISFALESGKTLALVGESGCGKTTLAKTIIGLQKTFSGEILYQNQAINRNHKSQTWRKNIQIIFQDPYSSINPRMMIKDVVAEGAVALKIWHSDIDIKVTKILQQVGLNGDILHRYPHEFSGGQRQRIVIARALAVNPKILICDEPTSSLDVSVQAQVLNLLKDIQTELNLAYLFITHNINAVAWLADSIYVMYLGKIVESGPTTMILNSPQHPYTKLLLQSLPNIYNTKDNMNDIPVTINEIDHDASLGCAFQDRCSSAIQQCKQQVPLLTLIGKEHDVACFLFANS